MKKQLAEILVREFKLEQKLAEDIVDRVLLFLKRKDHAKGVIPVPVSYLEKAMLAVRSYKERLELQVKNAPEVGSEDIIQVQEMRNLEFHLQELIFAHD